MKKIPLSTFILSGLCALNFSSSASAQPGSGIRIGEQTLLVPQLALSYNYNDNVAVRSRALSEGDVPLNAKQSDTYYSYNASLALTRMTDNRRLRLNGWYGQDAYQDYSDLDGDTYGVGGAFNWTRPGASTTVEVTGKYEHAVDRAGSDGLDLGTNPLLDVENISDRVERDMTRATVNINQDLMNRLGAAFIFSYYDTAYIEELYNDRTSYDYIVELNHQLSDKSKPYLRAGIGIDEDEGFEDDATKPFVLGGIRYTATEKLRFDLGAGYETYTRTPIGNEELEDSGVKYTLNANYKATAKSSIRVSGRNGYDSISNTSSSSRRENAVVLSYRHQTTRRFNQNLVLSWREDDYLSPIMVSGEEIDEVKETIRYQYKINYQTVRPWLSLFGNVSYEDGSSKIPNESYNETEVSLGAQLRY
ncbi:outer membrane beta-barrel protein [Kiritimatiellaeota bacterium B1221]|nr:outer membrane beta-barrel protein [Kiritimatiellaeota bacterium B1221]